MDAERWRRIEHLFHEALERPVADRAAFLAASAENAELRREVAELLAAEDGAEATLDHAIADAVELATDEPPPTAIGPYRVVEKLGEGGLATVYLAERVDPRLRVAIKVVKRGMDTAEILHRLRLERQILASLDHPNIARLLDGGSLEDGRPYVVMEYIDGEPLDVHCDRRRLDLDARLRLFLEICSAVHTAHRSLIIHRDLKPSNILVTRDGEPKLLDFGIAKLLDPERAEQTVARTMTGMRWLTPEYAAPEQVRGEPLTTAADIYALGVLLYELLCGRRPFDFTTGRPREIERLVAETRPPRPSTRLDAPGSDGVDATTIAEARDATVERLRRRLTGDLDTLVSVALRKEPERRYPSALAMGDDIRRFLDSRPLTARPDTALYRVGKFVRRHRTGVAAAALILVSLVGGMVATTRALLVANAERARAELHLAELEEVVDFNVEMFNIVDPGEARGNTVTVREVLDKAAAKVDDDLGHRPAVAARLLSTLGLVHQALGLYAPAGELIERSLDHRRRAFGDHGPEVARGVHDLASIRLDQRRVDEAEALFLDAIERRRTALGDRHADTAASIFGLASVAVVREAWEDAERLHRQALDWRRALLDPEDPRIADSLNDLGEVLLYQGQLDAATQAFEDALAIRRARLGEDHPQIAETLNNLGVAAAAQGRNAEAETILREALAMRRRLFAGPHRDVVRTLHNLGEVLTRQQNLDEAETLLREALDLAREGLGDDPVETGRQLRTLGQVLTAQQRHAEAAPLLRRALDLQIGALGPEHPETLYGRYQLARLLGELGRHEDALHWLGEQIEIQRRADGQIAKDVPFPLALSALQHAALDRCVRARETIHDAMEHASEDQLAAIRRYVDEVDQRCPSSALSAPVTDSSPSSSTPLHPDPDR